jgi:hypothetical protein
MSRGLTIVTWASAYGFARGTEPATAYVEQDEALRVLWNAENCPQPAAVGNSGHFGVGHALPAAVE